MRRYIDTHRELDLIWRDDPPLIEVGNRWKLRRFVNNWTSLIGPEPRAPRSLLGWFLSRTIGATVPGYVNHRWNGLTTLAFAKICRGLIAAEHPATGFRHVVPADEVTKCELLGLFRSGFRRPDIVVEPVEAAAAVDRTLVTEDGPTNAALWRAAGGCISPRPTSSG